MLKQFSHTLFTLLFLEAFHNPSCNTCQSKAQLAAHCQAYAPPQVLSSGFLLWLSWLRQSPLLLVYAEKCQVSFPESEWVVYALVTQTILQATWYVLTNRCSAKMWSAHTLFMLIQVNKDRKPCSASFFGGGVPTNIWMSFICLPFCFIVFCSQRGLDNKEGRGL